MLNSWTSSRICHIQSKTFPNLFLFWSEHKCVMLDNRGVIIKWQKNKTKRHGVKGFFNGRFPKTQNNTHFKTWQFKKKKKNAANNVINFYHKPYSLPFHPTDQRSWLIPKSLLWEDKTWLINLISIVRGQKVNGPGVHRHIHFTELFLCSYGWTEEKTIFLSFKVHKFVQLLYWWRIINEHWISFVGWF